MKSRFGDALEYEASEKVATQQFWKVAKDHELKPIGTPVLTDIQFNPGKDLNFKVKFEIIPIIDPKDYTDLEIKIPDYVVSEHEVEHELEHILKSNSTTEDVDVVGDGEFFIIKVDLQRITENGEPFAGSKPETLDIDLSNYRIQPEIRDNAKGKKVDLGLLKKIWDDITEIRTPWRAEWLNVKFSKKPYNFLIGLSNQHLITYDKIMDNGDVKQVTEELDQDTLMQDKLISLEEWLKNPNSQGLPGKSISDGNLYFYHPKDNSVARFDAYSSRASLDCFGNPSYSNSGLGVRFCRKVK